MNQLTPEFVEVLSYFEARVAQAERDEAAFLAEMACMREEVARMQAELDAEG